MQMKLGSDFLPELDRKATQRAVEAALEKYRICKYLTFDEREATITAGYSDMPKASGTSDQTGNIAIHNVDGHAARKAYCERVERAVKRLPRLERFLIEERYMSEESQYLTDQNIYNFKFQPPISVVTYMNIRWRAFYKMAFDLKVEVVVDKK